MRYKNLFFLIFYFVFGIFPDSHAYSFSYGNFFREARIDSPVIADKKQHAFLRIIFSSNEGNLSIHIAEAKLIPGEYKPENQKVLKDTVGNLIFHIMNKEMLVFEKIVIKDPYYINSDITNVADSSKADFSNNTSKEIIIRFNYQPEMQVVHILKVLENNLLQIISSFDLEFDE